MLVQFKKSEEELDKSVSDKAAAVKQAVDPTKTP